jgi:hypothetical protein
MIRQDEEYLSVNWLEELKCSTRASEIRKLQDLYAKKFNRISANARVAILNVAMVCSKVRDESPDQRLLGILHEPITDPPDPSHAGIYNISFDDEVIGELIREVIQETHPARV